MTRRWPRASARRWSTTLRFLLGVSIALWSVCEPAWASAIYEYEGSDFDTIVSDADPPAGGVAGEAEVDT